MPFCTECGARHAESAVVCPNCGEPVFGAPPEEALDDDVDLLDSDVNVSDELPELPPQAGPSANYMDEIDQIRSRIAAQSTSLQTLNDLTWSNPSAVKIRDELSEALARLHTLQPPAALAAGHADFVEGAELLADGFQRLVDATQQGNAEVAVAEAEMAIAEATNRFLRGADALNEYFTLQEAGLADEMPPTPPMRPSAASPPLDDEEEELPDLAALANLPGPPDEDEEIEPVGLTLDDLPPPPSLDEFDELDEPPDDPGVAGLPSALGPDDLPPPSMDEFDDLPGPPSLEELDGLDLDLPEPEPVGQPVAAFWPAPDVYSPAESRPSPSVHLGGPAPSYYPRADETDYPVDPPAGAWGGLGDPGTDSVLLEIESAWVRNRPHVYDAIERAIRSAVTNAMRSALDTRLRMEQEARGTLDRVAAERNRLLDEVEALRREAHALQSELAEMRRGLNELERERQMAQDRRQQIFADAESHRAHLLREIEQLGGQLDSMRQSIVSLLNMSAIGTAGIPDAPAPSSSSARQPSLPAPSAPPATRVNPGLTEVRISGVTSLGTNLQIQQAIKTLPGVSVDGQPRYRGGVITATLRHSPGFDVGEALVSLAEQPLSLIGSPEAGVLELTAT